MSICQDNPIKSNTMKYGGGGSISSNVVTWVSFLPSETEKEDIWWRHHVSDKRWLMSWMSSCFFSKNNPFQNGFNSTKFNYPYNWVLPFSIKIFSFNISVSQRATDENRRQLLSVGLLQSRGLPRSHFLNDVIAGNSANGMRTLLQILAGNLTGDDYHIPKMPLT